MAKKFERGVMPNGELMNPPSTITGVELEKPQLVTIAQVKKEVLTLPTGEQREKPVVYFKEFGNRPMVCNKVNEDAIVRGLGRKVSDWIGKQIVIYFDPSVKFGNQTPGGIRVRMPKPQQPAPAKEQAPDAKQQ